MKNDAIKIIMLLALPFQYFYVAVLVLPEKNLKFLYNLYYIN